MNAMSPIVVSGLIRPVFPVVSGLSRTVIPIASVVGRTVVLGGHPHA